VCSQGSFYNTPLASRTLVLRVVVDFISNAMTHNALTYTLTYALTYTTITVTVNGLCPDSDQKVCTLDASRVCYIASCCCEYVCTTWYRVYGVYVEGKDVAVQAATAARVTAVCSCDHPSVVARLRAGR
jgi:hypothetical protein